MGQKCQYLAKKASFGWNSAVFGQKNHFWGEWSKTFGTYQGANETPCWKHWPVRLLWAARDKKVQFWPEFFLCLGPKGIFFVWESRFFVKRAYHRYAWGCPKKVSTPKKISVSELWVIFGGSPRFLAIWGHSHFKSISTFNSSTKLGGTVRAIKNDNGPGSSRNYGETAVFTFVQKSVFLAKNPFFPK